MVTVWGTTGKESLRLLEELIVKALKTDPKEKIASPGNSPVDLRMKNYQQPRYLQQLYEDSILNEGEYKQKSILANELQLEIDTNHVQTLLHNTELCKNFYSYKSVRSRL